MINCLPGNGNQRTLEENHEKVEASLHISITELNEKLVKKFVRDTS